MVIKNGKIIDCFTEEFSDMRIEDGKIVEILPSIEPRIGEDILDASNYFVLPSIIDTDVSLRDNKLSSKRLDGLKNDAISGGVSVFALTPTFNPPLENETFMELMASRLKNDENISVILEVNALKNDKKLNDISIFLKNGAKIIYGDAELDLNLTRRVLQYSNMTQTPVFFNCEDKSLDEAGVMNDHEISFSLGLPGISKISEIATVAKIVEMAIFYDSKVLLQSISTHRSIELIHLAKQLNQNIFSQVSIHNLILNDSACLDFNTYAKISPPLREESERLKLIADLTDGKIDILTSLHSPKSLLFKDVPFEDASFGIDCIKDYLSICYTYLVEKNIISLKKLSELISLKPAIMLGCTNKGSFKIGNDADIIIFDPNHKKIIENKESLYFGKELKGKIIKTVKNSKVFANYHF